GNLPAAAPAMVPNAQDHLATLKDALQPSERQTAAEALIEGATGRSPEVRTALLTAVQQDPAATVRAACLRCLAKQGIRDQVYRDALAAAQRDQDMRVREELRGLAK